MRERIHAPLLITIAVLAIPGLGTYRHSRRLSDTDQERHSLSD